MTESIPPLEAFLADAAAWLDDQTTRTVTGDDQKLVWGQGEFSVSVFHALSYDDERELLERAKRGRSARPSAATTPSPPRSPTAASATRAATRRPSPASSASTTARPATRPTVSRPG